jgi:hypothetical protein
MSARHTPGPWVVNDFCTENDADTAVWTSHDPHTAKSICECHFNTVREIQRGEHGCHQLEAEANARLIAAAPDLLEALRNLVFTAQKMWDDAKPLKDTALVTVTHPMLEEARAAIVKATGAA